MTTSSEARSLLDAILGYGRDEHGTTPPGEKATRIATVDVAFDPTAAAGARVTFDGETVKTSRAYPWLGDPPLAGARVVLLPVGRSYVIAGPIGQLVPPTPASLKTVPVLIGTASGAQPRARYWRDEHGIVSIVGVHAKGASFGMGITLPVGFRPSADYWGADARTGAQYVIRAAGDIESTNNTAGDVTFAFRFPTT